MAVIFFVPTPRLVNCFAVYNTGILHQSIDERRIFYSGGRRCRGDWPQRLHSSREKIRERSFLFFLLCDAILFLLCEWGATHTRVNLHLSIDMCCMETKSL
jgi:hypothetical protein